MIKIHWFLFIIFLKPQNYKLILIILVGMFLVNIKLHYLIFISYFRNVKLWNHSFLTQLYKMKCILVFDHLNDVIYTKYNKKFAKHVNTFAKTQKLVPTESLDSKLLTNVIVQIFSPIVTSQRIMSCQFGNSYTSIQCQDGINMTFEDVSN